MRHELREFSEWLAATWVSEHLQDGVWIVPTVQTIHILAIGAVLTSASMVNLRLIGMGARMQSLTAVSENFVPRVWSALVVLIASGVVLILIEPARPLVNPVFFLKLALIVAVSLLTSVIARPLLRDAEFWERSRGRRFFGRGLALLSWALWVGTVCAGRWIAYTSSLAFS